MAKFKFISAAIGLALVGQVFGSALLSDAKASKQYDILIQNANVYEVGNDMDIAIKDGKIVAIEKSISKSKATKVIDATNKLVAPGFVDSHTHIDKALTLGDAEPGDLMAAIDAANKYVASVPKNKVYDDVIKRGRQVIEMAISNGTTAIKTNVFVNDKWGTEPLRAINDLKKQYKNYIDIYNATPFSDMGPLPADVLAEVEAAAAKGEVDFIAGYPSLTKDYKSTVDQIFAYAKKYNLPVDLHVDESDAPNIDCLKYVIDKTISEGMQGKVTVGHITALDAFGINDADAASVIAKAKEAKINVTTLTSCNMYLMGRDGNKPMRRGVTRVNELNKAGVNVSYASDNIRDPFRPFGNADMLEEALITAQVNQYGVRTDLNKVFKMGTYNPAANSLMKNYGMKVGCNADLVVFDAPSADEAIVSQSDKLYVLKNGKVVAENGKIIRKLDK
ncbi:MAG: amidohydrolase family protein [Clostridium sp.]